MSTNINSYTNLIMLSGSITQYQFIYWSLFDSPVSVFVTDEAATLTGDTGRTEANG